MIDRRQFFRRFSRITLGVAIAPVEAFKLPEIEAWAPIYGKPYIETIEPLQRTVNQQLSDLVHEIYTNRIVASVNMHSPMMKVFDECPAYPMDGERLVFDVDLKYPDPINHMENDHGDEEDHGQEAQG